ncbi:MAG: ABC transporter ATP-binding protein [Parcubacteria group bacterium]|jgi:ABC-type multidrug transport system fused ATPase/permease subunit
MISRNSKKDNTVQFDFRQFWIKLWRLLVPAHGKIIKFVIFVVVLEISRMAGPYILKYIIDLITNFQAEKIGQMIGLIALMFVANQAVSIMNFFSDRRIFDILITVESYLSDISFKKLVFLDLGYHERENSGNKVYKIQKGITKIDEMISSFSWEVIPTSIQVVVTTVVLFFINWRFGVTILVFVPIFLWLSLIVNSTNYLTRKKRHDLQEDAAGFMAQSIVNINTVQSFVQEKRERKNFRGMMDRVFEMILWEYGRYMKYNLWRNLVIDLGRASMLLFSIYLVWNNSITVGSMIFVFTISEKALISLYRISRIYDKIMEAGESVVRVDDLFQEKEDIFNNPKGIRPKEMEGAIEFKQVDFSYRSSDIKALENVSFKITSGSVTALVGPSGGGKTTVARMVYRHYDPQEGQVFLDGKDLREYDLFSFRKFFAIVPQEVEIFNTSVRDNISYAKPSASMKEIVAAARIANAEEFILKLREGYDTVVGERGVKLSGGQRQRIGIARAVLANPRVLIFDEATSNLDSYSEKLIQEALDKIEKGRTVIIIAHRLSTIKKADKIIVLENGRVVEEGSHIELSREEKGLYHKLLELQRMGDVE